MGIVQPLVQYFLWRHYCISPAVHTWGQKSPCSWLAKWKETEDARGREMSLCSFVWHRSTGQPFCCITVMHKEDGNWVCSWPCHRLWGPISWRPGNSWIHHSLEEVAKVLFTARSMWSIFSCNQVPWSPFWHHMLPERGLQAALLCLQPPSLCSFPVFLYPLLKRTLIIS